MTGNMLSTQSFKTPCHLFGRIFSLNQMIDVGFGKITELISVLLFTIFCHFLSLQRSISSFTCIAFDLSADGIVKELKKYYGVGSPCRTLLYCLRLAALYYFFTSPTIDLWQPTISAISLYE